MAEFCKPNSKAKTCVPVTLWTIPGCQFCFAEKGMLKGLGVPFKEISVRDRNALSQVVRVSGQTGAPVLKVGSKLVVGYSPKAIKRALGIRKRR